MSRPNLTIDCESDDDSDYLPPPPLSRSQFHSYLHCDEELTETDEDGFVPASSLLPTPMPTDDEMDSDIEFLGEEEAPTQQADAPYRLSYQDVSDPDASSDDSDYSVKP